MIRFFNWMGGRSTAFAFVILILGFILALVGKLSTQFLGLVAALQGWVTVRAIGQDKYSAQSAQTPPAPPAENGGNS